MNIEKEKSDSNNQHLVCAELNTKTIGDSYWPQAYEQ